MKKIVALFLLICCISSFGAAQGFLKSIKKGLESATGMQITDEPVFVYPEIGAWSMSLVSCNGNPATGEVNLRIKAMPLLRSPGTGVNCYLLIAVDQDGKTVKIGPWGSANRHDFSLLSSTEITFQPMINVPLTVQKVNVKFIIDIETAQNTFELRNVPVSWLHTNTTTTVQESTQHTTVVTEEIITTSTTVTPGSIVVTTSETPGHTERRVTGGGYDLQALRTCFFQFINLNGELEVVDTDLFDENQFVYSLTVGLKDKRFPVERAYEKLGNVKEDVRTKDYYMKHSAKCFVLAEKGRTATAERETITENYLYLAINKFVNDNADNGLYQKESSSLQRIIPRTKLVESAFGIKLNSNKEIIKALDDGAEHILGYISAHPPKKSKIAFMGDNEATCYSFEYRFYDMEMAFHAFIFSPITIHYEIRSWYDKDFDVTVYAYFYCVGYDNRGMLQALGADTYKAAKEDFKKRNNLDFDLYPLHCLMLGFDKYFKLIHYPVKVEEIYFPGQISWFVKETPTEKKTEVKKTTIQTTVITKEPETYTISPNSAARLAMNVVDIAEDARYTYLAGNVNYISKLIAVEKSSGKLTEVYKTTLGSKGDKGDVKRLMKDHEGKVLVEFSNYPIMVCYNAELEDTKLQFFDEWETLIYSKLKAVMPNGDVLMVRYGNENILADRKSGVIKYSSNELYFGELPGKVAVTPQGVIWEPKSGNYTLVSGLGSAPEPVITKFDTGYDSQFKGGINEIKITPKGDIYIASRFGLHKSSDNAKTWQSVKSIYNYGSFERVAPNNAAEVWAATNTANGYTVVKYNDKLSIVLYKVSEFDVTGANGNKIKLQTNARILFSDSANNLWIIGGTYNSQDVIIFNSGGIVGYREIAEKKSVGIQ